MQSLARLHAAEYIHLSGILPDSSHINPTAHNMRYSVCRNTTRNNLASFRLTVNHPWHLNSDDILLNSSRYCIQLNGQNIFYRVIKVPSLARGERYISITTYQWRPPQSWFSHPIAFWCSWFLPDNGITLCIHYSLFFVVLYLSSCCHFWLKLVVLLNSTVQLSRLRPTSYDDSFWKFW